MDKLSKLIKEAKPLYKRQQKRKAIVTALSAFCIPIMLVIAAYGICLEGNNVYMAMSQDDYMTQFLDNEDIILKVK